MTVFIEYLVMVSVFCMMLAVGLRTPFGQILEVGRDSRPLLCGLVANFIWIPALGLDAVERKHEAADSVDPRVLVLISLPAASPQSCRLSSAASRASSGGAAWRMRVLLFVRGGRRK